LKEDFLHYIWKYKLFNASKLVSHNGEEIEILNFGLQNSDAGPDFFNGKVKIGETVWAGNIEIHINASDWLKHKHQVDRAYDNVVLHVVYENDKTITDQNGSPIPTLELKPLINQELITKYGNLVYRLDSDIPCRGQIKEIDRFTINIWLNRLSVERLERKSNEINETLISNKNNWEETFYQYLFKYFGLKVNAHPFELLARNTPLKIIEKHNDVVSIEALLYGQAGYLERDLDDQAYIRFRKEYQFLRSKFELTPIDLSVWKMLRLRPGNFPTIRISQLANLLKKEARLFSKIIACESIKDLQKLFKVQASEYWNTRYQFGGIELDEKNKKLGLATINSILINVIVPFVFVYGKTKQDENLVDKALVWLEALKAENNTIIRKWNELGVTSSNAMQTQALIELKNNYCSQKKCLTCNIGNKILQL
jgi:hypothetical protein